MGRGSRYDLVGQATLCNDEPDNINPPSPSTVTVVPIPAEATPTEVINPMSCTYAADPDGGMGLCGDLGAEGW